MKLLRMFGTLVAAAVSAFRGLKALGSPGGDAPAPKNMKTYDGGRKSARVGARRQIQNQMFKGMKLGKAFAQYQRRYAN